MLEIFKKAGEVIADTASNLKFEVQKNAPTICLVTGIIGVGTAMIFACKSTLKLPEIIEEANDEKAKIENGEGSFVEEDGTVIPKGLTQEEKAEIRNIYFRAGFEIAKLYAPWVILTGASIGLIVKGHATLLAQNATISAYAMGLQKEFEEYRKQVRLKYGNEVDKELRFAKSTEELPGDISEGENSQCTDLSVYSDCYGYSKIFFGPNTSTAWENNATYNRRFVDMQFAAANYKLESRASAFGSEYGHLFLNELRDLLYVKRLSEGQDLGFLAKKGEVSHITYTIYQPNEDDPSFWIEFNLDGYIKNRI